jgi:hypothetical protein
MELLTYPHDISIEKRQPSWQYPSSQSTALALMECTFIGKVWVMEIKYTEDKVYIISSFIASDTVKVYIELFKTRNRN